MLYDHKGNPVSTGALKREQAAPRVTGVRTWADMAPSKSMTPARLARALRTAAEGDITEQARLFEDMEEKDSHIFTEISKRKRAVTGRTWTLDPGDDSERALRIRDEVAANIKALQPEDLFFDLLDAIGRHFSAVEMIWDFSSGQAQIDQAQHKPQHWFQYQRETDILTLRDNTMDGESLHPWKWILHTHKARSGSPYKGALYRVLAWLFLFRNYSLPAWAKFVESYGMPLRIGHYPAGTPEDEQDKLLASLGDIAADFAAIIPEGMHIEIMDQTQKGGTNPQKDFLDWTKRQISAAIVGATLTTDAVEKGTQALGTVHNDIRLDILASDILQLETTVSQQLVRPMVLLNHGADAPMPVFQISRPDTRDKKELAAIVKTLGEAGMTTIPVPWLHETFRIPEPADGEQTLGDLRKAAESPPAKNDNSSLNVNTMADSGDIAQPTPVDTLANALERERGEEIMHDMLDPVLEMLDTCSTLEEAKGMLETAFGSMNSARLEKDLARAMFSAAIYGGAKAKAGE